MALGAVEVSPLEMATAYDAFANGGRRVQAYGISRIRTPQGRVIYQRESGQSGQAINNPPLYYMNQVLRGVVTGGSGRGAAIAGRDLAGKTGTTSDYKDAWFVGYTGGFVAAVWVGKDDNTAMRGVTGSSSPRRHLEGLHGGGPAAPECAQHPQRPAHARGLVAPDPVGDLMSGLDQGGALVEPVDPDQGEPYLDQPGAVVQPTQPNRWRPSSRLVLRARRPAIAIRRTSSRKVVPSPSARARPCSSDRLNAAGQRRRQAARRPPAFFHFRFYAGVSADRTGRPPDIAPGCAVVGSVRWSAARRRSNAPWDRPIRPARQRPRSGTAGRGTDPGPLGGAQQRAAGGRQPAHRRRVLAVQRAVGALQVLGGVGVHRRLGLRRGRRRGGDRQSEGERQGEHGFHGAFLEGRRR